MTIVAVLRDERADGCNMLNVRWRARTLEAGDDCCFTAASFHLRTCVRLVEAYASAHVSSADDGARASTDIREFPT